MAKKITLKNKAGEVLCPHTAIEQVQGLKEALDGKLPLSGGTLTGSITAPTYKGATDKSGVYSEAIMSYTSAFANNDLNSERFLKAGMYRLDRVNDTINQPGGRGYGHLMTIRGGDSDNAAQMFFDYFDNGNAYIRTGSTNPNAGDFYILNRAWKQLLEDQVTTSHIAEKSINGSKIVSNVDLTGTPMMGVEPTLSSPDRTIASVGLVKKAVADLEIDTRNLIPDSASISRLGGSGDYVYITRKLPVGAKAGDTFVFNCDGMVNNQGSATEYSIVLYDWASQRSASNYLTLTAENRMGTLTLTRDVAAGSLYIFLYVGKYGATAGNNVTYINCSLVKGDKPMLTWQAAPEDVQTAITNAIDYTNDAIDKIENGETVAQKANSLYDADSNKYKNWGEIDTAITRKIGNKFEDYATKSYVQGEISKQVAVPIASETEYGKVSLATPEDVTAVENNNSAVNDSAKAVTPYTLKEYIASKNFATSSDISSAVTAAKTTIFFQVAQPAGGKDGDIWIIP